MKAASFAYARPDSLEQALEILRDADDARVLAGGQSLVPMLHMRLVRPTTVVDINRVSGLDDICVEDDHVVIGAMTTYSAIEGSHVLAAELPLLPAAVRYVGDRQVRNRGTIGGSLAQADPVGEMPLVCLALDATIEARSADGARQIGIDDHLVGAYTTDLEPEEVLVGVRVARRPRRCLIHEIARRHNDFAVLAIAIAATPTDAGTWQDVRIAVAGMDDRALLALDAMAALEGTDLGNDAITAAVATTADLGDPANDVRASEDYRRHLFDVHLGRCLARLREGVGTVGV